MRGRFADRRDHFLAPGLDPLGDGDFALTREQLDRAHFAQIHAHRIVGAAEILVVVIGGLGFFDGRAVGGFRLRLGLFGVFAFDDVDAELGKLGHGVFDLLG